MDSQPPTSSTSSTDYQDSTSKQGFVNWFRRVAPYIHAFRDKTFVVGIDGELAHQGFLHTLAQDVALLHALGIRIVLVYGSRPQVQEQLELRGIKSQFHNDLRITDEAALECAKEAAGELRLDIEAAFSQGLPNTPMAHSAVRVISGNFVTAKPMGIVDGIDLQHTGIVRKIDVLAIKQGLESNSIVLLSPLGFSPTGEAFNLTLEDVATSAARALQADKLIFVSDAAGVRGPDGQLIEELDVETAKSLIKDGNLSTMTQDYLEFCSLAVQSGVHRAHLLNLNLDGGLLLELFTHDGVGTIVSQDNLESLRPAHLDDASAIKTLIEPLELDGTLVSRGLDRIEHDIGSFIVLEHDGILWGCAALYEYPKAIGELACLVVHPSWQGTGDGERLLRSAETKAKRLGLKHLFVFTTQTSHFFLKRGFVVGRLDQLPVERRKGYNRNRNSQILFKTLV